jgi:release factor glutamine methyltransferase
VKSAAASVAALLHDASLRLSGALGLDRREARIEARALAVHAWQVETAWLIAHDTDVPDAVQAAVFLALVEQRLAGQPIAYLTGRREFYGRPFRVSPDVLIPRPETELLVDQALLHLPPGQPLRVLDLGTGSGCVAVTIALERPHAIVTAVDRSPAALALAERNARALKAHVRFLQSDWFGALAAERFDLIVANPPYIAAADPHLGRGDVRFEPLAALASGSDGFDDLRRIVRDAPAYIAPAGWLWLEHGFEQAELTQHLLREAGLGDVLSRPDVAGLPRISGARCRKILQPVDCGLARRG